MTLWLNTTIYSSALSGRLHFISDYYKLDGQLTVSVTRDCPFTRSCRHAGRSIGSVV